MRSQLLTKHARMHATPRQLFVRSKKKSLNPTSIFKECGLATILSCLQMYCGHKAKSEARSRKAGAPQKAGTSRWVPKVKVPIKIDKELEWFNFFIRDNATCISFGLFFFPFLQFVPCYHGPDLYLYPQWRWFSFMQITPISNQPALKGNGSGGRVSPNSQVLSTSSPNSPIHPHTITRIPC